MSSSETVEGFISFDIRRNYRFVNLKDLNSQGLVFNQISFSCLLTRSLTFSLLGCVSIKRINKYKINLFYYRHLR